MACSSSCVILGPAGPGSAAATCRGYKPFLYTNKQIFRWVSFCVCGFFLFCACTKYYLNLFKSWAPASGGRGMSVPAPHSSSFLTFSVSAAIMAKKSTGMGILAALGSAPRSNNSFMVSKRMRCLLRQNTHRLLTLIKHNIMGTCLILSRSPFYRQNSSDTSRHGLH